jgi:DNA-binding NarL/FixJ family response regulator
VGTLRILVVGMPRLVREMIERTIKAQPDMEVLVDARAVEDIGADGASAPDFVVCGLDFPWLPDQYRTLLEEQPHAKVLGIDAAGGHAYLYELRPQRVAIGEVSPDDIVEAIRLAAAGSAS